MWPLKKPVCHVPFGLLPMLEPHWDRACRSSNKQTEWKVTFPTVHLILDPWVLKPLLQIAFNSKGTEATFAKAWSLSSEKYSQWLCHIQLCWESWTNDKSDLWFIFLMGERNNKENMRLWVFLFPLLYPRSPFLGPELQLCPIPATVRSQDSETELSFAMGAFI